MVMVATIPGAPCGRHNFQQRSRSWMESASYQ